MEPLKDGTYILDGRDDKLESRISLDQRNEVTDERARVDPEARSAGGET